MAGAVVGGLVSGAIPDTALLLVIGATLLYFGVDLLRSQPRPRGPRATARALDIRAAVVSGALIGLLGGLVGLILGALRMPALLRWVGEVPARAVGTNLAVGLLGRRGRASSGTFRAASTGPHLGAGAAASVPGALLGARLTGRLERAPVAARDRRRAGGRGHGHRAAGIGLAVRSLLKALPDLVDRCLDGVRRRRQPVQPLERRISPGRLLRALLAHSEEYLYLKDTEGRYRMASSSLARVLGLDSPDELLGKDDREVLPPETGRPGDERRPGDPRAGEPMVDDQQSGTFDGQEYWNTTTKLPVRDDQGEIVGIFGRPAT